MACRFRRHGLTGANANATEHRLDSDYFILSGHSMRMTVASPSVLPPVRRGVGAVAVAAVVRGGRVSFLSEILLSTGRNSLIIETSFWSAALGISDSTKVQKIIEPTKYLVYFLHVFYSLFIAFIQSSGKKAFYGACSTKTRDSRITNPTERGEVHPLHPCK